MFCKRWQDHIRVQLIYNIESGARCWKFRYQYREKGYVNHRRQNSLCTLQIKQTVFSMLSADHNLKHILY